MKKSNYHFIIKYFLMMCLLFLGSLPTILAIENNNIQVTNVRVEDISASGYTVKAHIEDSFGIKDVQFPTWTEKEWQDDLSWDSGKVEGNEVSYRVNTKDHGYENGDYLTDIYVESVNGDRIAVSGARVNVPKNIVTVENIAISNVSETGYTVSCQLSDELGITNVLFPTWTTNKGQDDIVWEYGVKNGKTITYRVNIKKHRYEFGDYNTHIYLKNFDGSTTYIGRLVQEVKSTGSHQDWTYINGEKYFYNSLGQLIGNGPSKKVIDVSEHQGEIDWNMVQQYGDIDGVILRCGYGSADGQEDKQFARNISELNRLGIPYGIYLYSYAENGNDGISEANFVLRLINKYNIRLSYPIYYDIEHFKLGTEYIDVSKTQYEELIPAFINRLKSAGYNNVGVYSYTNYLNTVLNSSIILPYVSWVAEYNHNCSFSGSYFGWQYSSSEYVPGINGSVDMSVWFN